jgi:hypothetical protein
MTAKEIEKRLTALENISAPEVIPPIFCFFVQPGQSIDGWVHDGFTHWRMPQETESDLQGRIKKIIQATPGELVILHSASKDNEFTD